MSVTLNSYLWQSMERRSGRLSKTLSLNFQFCFLNKNPHFDWKQMFAKEWSYSNSRSASVLRWDMWLSPYNPLKDTQRTASEEKNCENMSNFNTLYTRDWRERCLFLCVPVLAAGAPVMSHSQELPSSFLPRGKKICKWKHVFQNHRTELLTKRGSPWTESLHESYTRNLNTQYAAKLSLRIVIDADLV